MKGVINHILIKLAYNTPNYPSHRFIYKFFEPLRQMIWRKLFAKFGKNTYIRSEVYISGHSRIEIGKESIIGPKSIINATEKINIGDFFLSGPQLIIYTAEHGIENTGVPFIKQLNTTAPVIIGDNVYTGARVTILKGVTIGSNVIIATGSVVVSDIPSNEIWGGVPAKKIKSL